MNQEKINEILETYKKKLEYDRQRYQQKKDDEVFKAKNRQHAKVYYHKNKDKYKQKYKDSQEDKKLKNTFYYYRRLNRLNDLQHKHPDKWSTLLQMGLVSDQALPTEPL
tara:strand:- start:3238 stop:3564 length:327 start_codon:yes stop_codon:yes gene_type:complete